MSILSLRPLSAREAAFVAFVLGAATTACVNVLLAVSWITFTFMSVALLLSLIAVASNASELDEH